MSYLLVLAFWTCAIALIRRDTASRDGISGATWIPTFWAGIALSRPVTLWLGFGGGEDTMEGSPLDRLFYFGIILMALMVLSKRNINWSRFIAANWPIFLFYGYLLVSVLWAESSIVSFKRWFKDLGNVFVALILLTERNPQQAIRAVFTRCAYVLLPLSVIFIRYFPDLGRRYTRSGGLEVTGVTMQKNSLGILVVVCGLILLWDWLEKPRLTTFPRAKWERYLPLGFFILGAYLIYQCDSKTSIVCLVVSATMLLATRLSLLRDRVAMVGRLTIAAFGGFYLLDWLFGVKESVIAGLGRDMTFTGRTDVWRELLDLNTDPIIGTGFLSFWSDTSYRARLPDWVAYSAHNGYLETYIDGGAIGVFFLAVMLLGVGFRLDRQLTMGSNYSLVRFSVFLILLIGDFSESHFARMSPLWFLFLLTALEVPGRKILQNTPQSFSRVAKAPPVPTWIPSPVL